MLNELVEMFEDQEVKVKTDKGETLINLVSTAKVCGVVNYDNGKNKIRWSNIKAKLKSINATCSRDTKVSPQYIEELQYILDEIDNTDDRNSIYMSSWLSKRLAMECHSDKAMQYKNFLATLDERFHKGMLTPQNNNMEIASMVGQVMTQILPTLTAELAKQFTPVVTEAKEQVNKMSELIYDQSQIYDNDREKLKDLIGIRSGNTTKLVNFIKDKLSDKLGYEVKAKNSLDFIKIKNQVFKEFDILKWEDLPIGKYNRVHAYIDELIDETYDN